MKIKKDNKKRKRKKKKKKKKKKNRAERKEMLVLGQTFSFLNFFRDIRNNSQSNTQIG